MARNALRLSSAIDRVASRGVEALRVWAVQALSDRIARLETSKMDSKAARTWRALLRMRALLLTFDPRMKSLHWSATRRLVMLLDPVSAGLWPFLRRRRGLNRRQTLARWLVMRANPSVHEVLTAAAFVRVDRVLHVLQQKSVEQILAESRERFMSRSQQGVPPLSLNSSVEAGKPR